VRGLISRGRGEGFRGVGRALLSPLPEITSPLSAEIPWQESDDLRGEGGKGGRLAPAGRRGLRPERGEAKARGLRRESRLAIVGVGRAGQADDGAGPALCAALQKLGGSHPERLVVNAGTAPENVTGLLRRFRPDVVVLVDAAAMNRRPGAVRWLERGCALGCSASTHTLPLGMLATYLRESLGCDVRLLGIQPAVIGEEGPLSVPVRRTVERLARRLTMVKERSG